MKVIGYARTSTSAQDKAETIQIQITEIEKFAKTNNLELVKIFKDGGVSGSLAKRKGLAELYEFIASHKDIEAIIIFKLDRLGRELRIQENLLHDFQNNHDLDIISVKEKDLGGDDPTRVLMRQILGSFAEYEKSIIALRMSLGRIKKAKSDGYAGGSPSFGYSAKNKSLIINQNQADIVKKIYHMKRFQRKSLNQIAKELNDLGVATSRGGQWYARTIKNILDKKKLYLKGQLKYTNCVSQKPELVLI